VDAQLQTSYTREPNLGSARVQGYLCNRKLRFTLFFCRAQYRGIYGLAVCGPLHFSHSAALIRELRLQNPLHPGMAKQQDYRTIAGVSGAGKAGTSRLGRDSQKVEVAKAQLFPVGFPEFEQRS